MKHLDFSKLLAEPEALRRYHAAAHAMQTGVALKMEHDGTETQPKHLRVGVNSALVDGAALAELLIHKGVITKDEYLTTIALGMEREVEMYKEWVADHFPGANINLA